MSNMDIIGITALMSIIGIYTSLFVKFLIWLDEQDRAEKSREPEIEIPKK